jgi:hypothetical protein
MRMVMNKLMRNGSEIAKDVLMPIGVGGAGFVAARALSNLDMVESKLGSNAKIVTPIVGIVATLALAKPLKLSTTNRNFLALGMGVVALDAVMKKIAPDFMADRAPALPTPSGTSGFGTYYDVSAAGAPYQGMLGLGETYYAAAGVGEMYEAAAGGIGETYYAAAGVGETYEAAAGNFDDPTIEGELLLSGAEVSAGVAPTSTIEPTDVARQAGNFLPVRPTTQPFAARSQAGGLFARNLFTGMVG